MSQFTVQTGTPKLLFGTGDVSLVDCALIGFYVYDDMEIAEGTLILRQGGSTGATISGTLPLTLGYHHFPACCNGGLHATMNMATYIERVTFFVVEGVS